MRCSAVWCGDAWRGDAWRGEKGPSEKRPLGHLEKRAGLGLCVLLVTFDKVNATNSKTKPTEGGGEGEPSEMIAGRTLEPLHRHDVHLWLVLCSTTAAPLQAVCRVVSDSLRITVCAPIFCTVAQAHVVDAELLPYLVEPVVCAIRSETELSLVFTFGLEGA